MGILLYIIIKNGKEDPSSLAMDRQMYLFSPHLFHVPRPLTQVMSFINSAGTAALPLP